MERLARTRARLSGAAVVGVGMLLLGAAAYVFLALAGHALDPQGFTAVSSVYFVVAIVGPGLFVAVEQATNREVSARESAGQGIGPVARSASAVAVGMTVVVVAALLALSPVLVDRVFAGSWALLVAILVSVIGAAAVYTLRGLYAGARRFGWYSATLGAEGLGRLLPCAALVLVGVAEPVLFGFAFVVGAGFAALVTVAGMRGRTGADLPAPPVDRGGLGREVGLLATASGLTLLVANLAPVVVTSRLVTDAATAAAFASLFVLARTPLFLFGPVQALLIPGLSAAAAAGDRASLRRQTGIALGLVGVVGGLGVLLAWLGGSWAAQTFFDAPVPLAGGYAAALCVGTVGMMAAQVLQAVLVALRASRSATIAWAVGTALYVPILFLPLPAVLAATIAQAVAPAVVVGLMVVGVRSGTRKLARPTVPAG
jgi:O-antigen/teichoic acid export membrane protein